jgi:eukaryotic-like serine/threonine-protein kinase
MSVVNKSTPTGDHARTDGDADTADTVAQTVVAQSAGATPPLTPMPPMLTDPLAQTGAADNPVHGSAAKSMARTRGDSAPAPGPLSHSQERMIGTTLAGRYAITRKLGQGGMGAVFEATHTLIGKRVAVKVLLEKFAQREAIVARLEQEARLASSIGHEHIIDIIDFGTTEDGRTFVAMEYLDGESLAECLHREHQLSEARIVAIACQTASALGAAHDKGIVHRDVKPENLFLLQRQQRDFVKVVDFGISKSLRSSDPDGLEASPRLTQTGMVLGTPLYMSPEQARGDEQVTAQVDVYALGVIMYEAATGRVPFTGNNYLSVISQVLSEEPPSPRSLRPELSEEFEAVIFRAMSKDRAARYQSAAELLADLDILRSDPKRSTERPRIVAPKRAKNASNQRLRGGTKILIWSAAIAVVVAAVALTVRSTMMTAPPALVVAASVDARTKPDAPPVTAVVVESVTIMIAIESTPSGASIWEGARKIGVTPVQYPAQRGSKEAIELVARLDGYKDAQVVIRPSIDAAEPVKVTLTKAAPTHTGKNPKRDVPGGKEVPNSNGPGGKKTTGDLGGYPIPPEPSK